jgi:hypothetical protein
MSAAQVRRAVSNVVDGLADVVAFNLRGCRVSVGRDGAGYRVVVARDGKPVADVSGVLGVRVVAVVLAAVK